MKVKLIVSLLIAAAFTCEAHAEESPLDDPLTMLSIFKMTGACGILDSMIQFQKSTRMPGGDDFVTRFWAVEAARLGLTIEQLSDQCSKSIEIYDTTWNALESEQ